MGRTKKSIKDKILANWLEEFRNNSTRSTYISALNLFKKVLGIEDLSKYLKGNLNVISDLKKFLTSLRGHIKL